MTLPIYNSGLYGYYDTALTQEGIISIGSGKFVIVANNVGPSSEIGFIVVEVDSNGTPTFGSPGYFASTGNFTNPLAYYDKASEQVVVFWYSKGYTVSSVSGLTMTEVGRGVLPTTQSFNEAVIYHEGSDSAILIANYANTDNKTRLFSLRLVGTSLVVNEALSGGISGRAQNNNCKIADCGERCLLAFVNQSSYPEPEVRVLSGMGTANFDYSAGLSLPIASHPYCLGLAGSGDGRFTGYWSKNSSAVPYLVAGEITGSNSVSYGISPLQYSGPNWGDYYGDFMGDGATVGEGKGVFVNRIDGNSIHMFSIETDSGLNTTVTSDSTSQTGLNLPNVNYCHVSIAYDVSIEQGLCAFNINDGSNNSQIYVSSLYVEAPVVPVPIFWTNHTKQTERGAISEGYLLKEKTVSVIAGAAGQSYIPPTPAVSPKVVSRAGVNFVCKRVI